MRGGSLAAGARAGRPGAAGPVAQVSRQGHRARTTATTVHGQGERRRGERSGEEQGDPDGDPTIRARDGIVDSGTVGSGTVGSSRVRSGTVGSGTIGSSTVGSSTIGSSTVGSSTVGSSTIDSGPIDSGPIDSGTIDSGTIGCCRRVRCGRGCAVGRRDEGRDGVRGVRVGRVEACRLERRGVESGRDESVEVPARRAHGVEVDPRRPERREVDGERAVTGSVLRRARARTRTRACARPPSLLRRCGTVTGVGVDGHGTRRDREHRQHGVEGHGQDRGSQDGDGAGAGPVGGAGAEHPRDEHECADRAEHGGSGHVTARQAVADDGTREHGCAQTGPAREHRRGPARAGPPVGRHQQNIARAAARVQPLNRFSHPTARDRTTEAPTSRPRRAPHLNPAAGPAPHPRGGPRTSSARHAPDPAPDRPRLRPGPGRYPGRSPSSSQAADGGPSDPWDPALARPG